MRRLWYGAHIIATLAAVDLAFRYIHPDSVGGLDQASAAWWSGIQAFLLFQACSAFGLLLLMPKNHTIFNYILAISSFMSVILAYFAAMVAAITL